MKSQLGHFKAAQAKIVFFNSDEYKESEKARRQALLAPEHVMVDFDRVWCPFEQKIRPTVLCERECDCDYHEVLDEEWDEIPSA